MPEDQRSVSEQILDEINHEQSNNEDYNEGYSGLYNGTSFVFLVPEALNPNVVIDPPDVRVWVYIKTGEVEWDPSNVDYRF